MCFAKKPGQTGLFDQLEHAKFVNLITARFKTRDPFFQSEAAMEQMPLYAAAHI
jgi:hypothetical protein